MIVIIEQNDLHLPNFPYEFLNYGEFHAKLIAFQTTQKTDDSPDTYSITRTIYTITKKSELSRNELLEYINKSL